MRHDELARTADALRRGETPDGVEIVKRNPVRVVARIGGAALKVFLRASRTPAREARALARADALGVPVPRLVGHGDGWIATAWCDAGPAQRDDLARILPVVAHMHARGMLHRDLHLGNLLVGAEGPILLDVQRSAFLPWIPGWLARWELGYLAYSLGEPLPASLANARRWCERRAHTHWRSRTKRCCKESSGFTAFSHGGASGFRRREADPSALRAALDAAAGATPLKVGLSSQLVRHGAWILKEHASPRRARAAWIGGHGLEARGFATGRALAWAGRWLVMEDAGPTLIDWVDAQFARAADDVRRQMALALADLLAALHRRGVYHADLKANNIAWAPGATPRLLDYGRVRFGRRVGWRRRVKNLAQLNAALPDTVPCALREVALERYLATSGFCGDAARLRRDVIALSLRRQHRWSGS